MSKFLSRKFLLAVGVVLLVIADKKFTLGLGLDGDTVKALVIIALAYIGVEGAADVVGAIKKKE